MIAIWIAIGVVGPCGLRHSRGIKCYAERF